MRPVVPQTLKQAGIVEVLHQTSTIVSGNVSNVSAVGDTAANIPVHHYNSFTLHALHLHIEDIVPGHRLIRYTCRAPTGKNHPVANLLMPVHPLITITDIGVTIRVMMRGRRGLTDAMALPTA
jgi:hypothetical protein